MCDSIFTATRIEACQDIFKTQSGPLNCENVEFAVKFLTLTKQKPNFVIGLIIIKVNIERLERVTRKFLKNYFTLTIASMATVTLKIGVL